MGVSDGVRMIKKAYEKREEQLAFQMYLAVYPNMTEETFQTFGEFYQPLNNKRNQHEPSQPKEPTAEEILSKVRDMTISNDWR